MSSNSCHKRGREADPLSSDWFFVTNAEDLKPGESMLVKIPNAGKVAVFRHASGDFYALNDKCAHGKGQLSQGDIEDLGRCAMGTHVDGSSIGGPCVRCPKHRSKMAGGLYFSLQDGRSFVKGHTKHYRERFQVAAFEVQVIKEGAVEKVYVSMVPTEATRSQGKRKIWKHEDGGNVEANASSILTCVSSTQGDTHSTWSTWRLKRVRRITPMANIYTFKLVGKHSSRTSVMPPAVWHVSLRTPHSEPSDVSIDLVRDYTPISTREEWQRGKIRLLIKLYPEGYMSSILARMSPGDTMDVAPPEPTVTTPYLQLPGCASCETPRSGMGAAWPSDLTITMLVGGTGITPALQLVELVAHEPSIFRAAGNVRALLIYSTRNTEIYLSNELEQIIMRGQGRITVVLALTGTEDEDPLVTMNRCKEIHVEQGRVTQHMIERWHPPRGSVGACIHGIVCGPQGMMDSASKMLRNIGYSAEHIVELEA